LTDYFVVLIRPVVHQRIMNRRVSRPGHWHPVAVDDDPHLAEAMARVVAEEPEVFDARVVADGNLARELGSVEFERIMDLLRNPTIQDTRRAAELHMEAAARLAHEARPSAS
jgi:hypothetical protein